MKPENFKRVEEIKSQLKDLDGMESAASGEIFVHGRQKPNYGSILLNAAATSDFLAVIQGNIKLSIGMKRRKLLAELEAL
jgi:hypothetical protein